MIVYFMLIIYWLISYLFFEKKKNARNARIVYSVFAGLGLFFVMAFRHPSVGNDIIRYLTFFNNHTPEINIEIFQYDEWGYQFFIRVLRNIGVYNQGYLIVTSAIMVISFLLLYYKYSNNIFLSLFLHMTIGIFTLSMSGIRQTIAICFLMLAYHLALKNKLVLFITAVFFAYSFHNSAIVFLPVYFLRNIKITRKKGIAILSTAPLLFYFRQSLTPLINYIAPVRYIQRYELISTNTINPLLIVIALLIALSYIMLIKDIHIVNENEERIFSFLFILVYLNLFFSVLGASSIMLGRLSYYFLPFVTILIPNIITKIKNKNLKLIGFYLCLTLPLIQFIMSTPGGTLAIDSYLFFWQ